MADQPIQGPPIQLAHRHVFGLKADVHSNVQFAEEHQVIYPAGHDTILYSSDTKTQKHFPGHEEAVAITALAISQNKRWLAVAEKRQDHASVTILDLVTSKKRKSLSFRDADPSYDVREFKCLAFSSENKYLLTQGGLSPTDPMKHWILIYWTWDKQRPVAAHGVSDRKFAAINGVSFNPTDSQQVTVIGDGIFRFFRVHDGTFKAQPTQLTNRRDAQNYTCHTWLSDDRLVVGCDNGDILLFDHVGDFKMALPCSPGEPGSTLCMAMYTKGFLCGGSGSTVRVFEKSDDPKEWFRLVKEIKLEVNANQTSQPAPGQTAAASVVSLATAPSEESFAATTSHQQLFQVQLLNSDLLKSDDAASVEHILTSNHVGSILGMDSCARKPLVITCGADKSVRVWNYLEKNCELCRFFNEEALSVALHPSGFHVIVGFSDKLRLMNLLMEDLKPFKDIPIKACRECRFSNGGQYFAATNQNQIQVYKTYTCEQVAVLRGHNNKVRSLSWTQDDATLVSAGMDGAVYEYSILRGGVRTSDFVAKGINFSCVIVYTDPSTGNNTMYVVGSDKLLKEIYASQVQQCMDTTTTAGQIVLSSSAKVMFASVAEPGMPGEVRCYKFPLDGEFTSYQCHSSPATRLRATYDDQYLFSCGEDGCLFIFDVRRKDRAVSKRDKEQVLPMADEILVTRQFLEDKQAQLVDLERQVDELSNQIDFQLRHRDSYHKEKMAELEDKYGQEIEQERTKYELLREEKNDMEMEYEENIKNLEEMHAKQIQDLEASFQHKMMVEVGRYQKLAAEREAEHQTWERQDREFMDEHRRQVQEMQRKDQEQQQHDKTQLIRIVEDKALNEKVHQETLSQLEVDADSEIQELKEQYEKKLAQEKEDKVRLRGQAGIHKKHHEDLKRQMQKKEEELKQMRDEASKKQERIDKLINDRERNLKLIKERDKTIGEREQTIYELKKANQELEKYKFVLDYKIKELKAQIDPKNEDIAEMKKQIQSMDADLEDYHRKNKQLQLDISALVTKQKNLQEEIIIQRSKLTDTQTLIKRFKNDLHECVQFIQEPKQLQDKLQVLYRKYVPNGVKKQELDTDIQKEYQRQKEYLDKSVESLRKKLAKDSEVHQQDNMRIMQENVSLIREINDLRREITALKKERQQQKLDVVRQKRSGKRGGLQLTKEQKVELEGTREANQQEIAMLRARLDTRMLEMQQASGNLPSV